MFQQYKAAYKNKFKCSTMITFKKKLEKYVYNNINPKNSMQIQYASAAKALKEISKLAI